MSPDLKRYPTLEESFLLLLVHLFFFLGLGLSLVNVKSIISDKSALIVIFRLLRLNTVFFLSLTA